MIKELSIIATTIKQNHPELNEKNICFTYLTCLLFDIELKNFFDESLLDLIAPYFIDFKLEDNKQEIHLLYEQFLSEYDKQQQKNLGVWYTPQPIVNYMINAAHHISLCKFNISLNDKDNQIIDPATGTGTFISTLLETVSNPDIHAVEIDPTSSQFAALNFLSKNKDNKVNLHTLNTLEGSLKLNKPEKLRIIIGNPPYNGSSKNNSKFITNLMEAYKTEFNIGPGLNDDYIKFFRYAESLIQEVDKGMLLFITNSSFIKSQAAQEMRKSLLSTFDEIYIINLNGNKNKQDKNVFNIKTETCITILIKTNQKEKNSLAKVFYEDLIGSAEFKFDWLNNNPFQVEGV